MAVKIIAKLKPALEMLGAMLAGLALLAVAWWMFWTHYDPHVNVPAPVRLEAPSLDGSATGKVLLLADVAPQGEAATAGGARKRDRLESMEALARSFDATVGSLGAPATDSERSWPLARGPVAKIDPKHLPGVRRVGIDAVTLANGGIMGYGGWGLGDTLNHLDDAGIAHLGAHLSEAGARRGLVIETSGGRLGLLTCMENRFGWRMRDMAFALDTPFRPWAGVARLRYSDLRLDIARMRAASDVVAVVVTWGGSSRHITRRQETIGRAIIDLGADAVIGHHPLGAQPLELHRGRPIAYGIGNHAADGTGVSNNGLAMALALRLERSRLRELELIPLAATTSPGAAAGASPASLLEPSARRGAIIEWRGDRGVVSLPDVH